VPGALPIYDDIEVELRNKCEDAVLNRSDKATEVPMIVKSFWLCIRSLLALY
jgi:cobalamin-dependent methionine synthase I